MRKYINKIHKDARTISRTKDLKSKAGDTLVVLKKPNETKLQQTIYND